MFEIKQLAAPARRIDGLQRSREAPETFQIPSRDERETAKIGEYVKVGVESDELGGERFWVEIVARSDDGQYIARVDNDLYDGWGFNCDDHVMFGPCHILAVQ